MHPILKTNVKKLFTIYPAQKAARQKSLVSESYEVELMYIESWTVLRCTLIIYRPEGWKKIPSGQESLFKA